MAEKEIGKVIHWYDKIGVAVIRLSAPLAVGDQIKIRKDGNEFEASISSMQVNHKDIQTGKKGDEVAIKLPEKAREGSVILQ